MIDIVLSELSVSFDDFHPNEVNLKLIPSVILGGLSVHDQIKQTGLEVPKNHNKSTEGSSVHDEVIY